MDKIILKDISLEDKELFNFYFQKYPSFLCDFNFNNLFLWSFYYKYKWFLYKNRIIIYNELTDFILEPLGEFLNIEEIFYISDLFKSIDKSGNFIFYSINYLNYFLKLNLIEDSSELQNYFNLYNYQLKNIFNYSTNNLINEKFNCNPFGDTEKSEDNKKKDINNLWNKKIRIKTDRASANYIYNSQDLANLSGRKFHNKKNLVNQFIKNYKNYKFELYKSSTINCDIFKKCYELNKYWYEKKIKNLEINNDIFFNELLKNEIYILENLCKYFSKLDLDLFLLYVDNQIVSFSVGSTQNIDMYTIHFEKFDSDFIGSSQMINYLSSNYLKDKYKWINREDDLGFENLRNSKLSYNPYIILLPFEFLF